MKKVRVLMRLITVCILAVVMFSVKGTWLVCASEGDVAVVVDGEGTEVGSYATLPEAFVACSNGDTIRILSDINEPDLAIGYNQGEDNKHIILDLNGKSVTLQMLEVDYSLYIMNGTLTASVSNGNICFTNALLTVSNVNIYTDMLSWMTDDGVSIKNGSNITLNGSSCWFEKLFMDKNCVFSVKNGSGVGNYEHFADGLDGVKDFLPEGLSIKNTTIIDDATGAKATDFVLRYRSLSDTSEIAVSINPKSYVYDGKEKRPAVTVSYGGKDLTEGVSYSCVYTDNINAGTAKVTISGMNSLHGQIVENFTIDKAKQKAPTGLVPIAETVDGKNDGQISNLTKAMEYSKDKKNWSACAGSVMKNLMDGSYYVRYSETKNYYASPAAKVVVGKGKTPASNEPTTGDDTTEAPTTEKPTAEEPTTGAVTTEEPTTGEQTTEAVSTEKQTTDATSTEQTTTEGTKATTATPNTGDDSSVAWFIMLMTVCLLGAAGVVVYKKER